MNPPAHRSLHGGLLAVSLSIFTSSSTLVCCALPAFLVAIGAGAALAGIVSAVPGLVWLSAHKPLVFGVAGFMLVVAGLLRAQGRRLPCPIEPELRRACMRVRRASTVIYLCSILMYAVGGLFAFVLPLAG